MLQGTQTPSYDSPQIWNWKEIYNFVRSKIIDADVSWPGSVDGIKSEHMAAIEKATNELWDLCLGAVQHVMDNNLYSKFNIPEWAIPNYNDIHLLKNFISN